MTAARNHRRRAFTLRDLLMVIGVIAVILGISVPFIERSREAARINECQNKLKQVGFALLNFEDHGRCFPPIAWDTGFTPGTSSDPAAPGYSWIVAILPDIDESSLWQGVFTNSQKFQLPAFSPKNVTTGTRHIASAQVASMLCPSFTNGQLLDSSPRTVGVPGMLETGTLPESYSPFFRPNGEGLGITNYHGIVGTHIDPELKSAANPNNGGMKLHGANYRSGMPLSALVDGTSKVPVVCETRERRFSSWYDGTMNWVVAARHGDPVIGPGALNPPVSAWGENRILPIQGLPLPPNRLVIGTDGTGKDGGSALNFGPTSANPTAVYLPAEALVDPNISSSPPGRLRGPSSLHAGGIVNHVFADGHVQSINDGIDPNMYLWIVTRNGGEPSSAE